MTDSYLCISWQEPGDGQDWRHRTRPVTPNMDRTTASYEMAYASEVPDGCTVRVCNLRYAETDTIKVSNRYSFVWRLPK